VRTDLHQHLWPEEFVTALRGRPEPPRLRGWTLELLGEPAFRVDAADHDPGRRLDLARADGLGRVLVSLSSPLGIEYLPPREATPLLDAYHDGAAELPAPFGAWAAAGLAEVDPGRLEADLRRGFVGLQLPANALVDRAGYDRCAPLLAVLEEHDRPLFIHPGSVPPAAAVPGWWPALVPYVQQLHASWFALRAFGRARHPRLRVAFTALAGLAPLHGERFVARGGDPARVDRLAFLETSSYGARAVDATVRAVGIDVVVNGSDRPYAAPVEFCLGAAADHAIVVVNPDRLLYGDRA
jgi:hypothetical protein